MVVLYYGTIFSYLHSIHALTQNLGFI